MDHHCDAIGVCVALRNHKVFLLFILYGTILVFIYGGTALALIPVLPFQTFPYHLVLDGFIGGSLGILASWLFTVQMRNILIGKTSIELEFKIDFKDEFTPWQRLVQVMGPFSVKWFIPIPLEYDLGDPFQWEVPETELSEEEEKQKVE
jgi:hypothetical protein